MGTSEVGGIGVGTPVTRQQGGAGAAGALGAVIPLG